ncbi:formylglycine-generating enzyme family protein [Kaarinaea lacus]
MYKKRNFIVITQLVAISLLFVACNSLPEKPYQPFETFNDKLTNGENGPAMIVIPAGRFMMGPNAKQSTTFPSEQPLHPVRIKRQFAIGKFELTFRDYDIFVNATGYDKPSDRGWGTLDWGRNKTPVFNVNWHDAKRYLEWLSEQTGAHYRLPTEAEWEYAARAGTTTVFSTGDCIDTDLANFHGKEALNDCPLSQLYRGRVIDTGSFPPNPWGLHDVHGNILEWTEDCWHDSYEQAPDDGSAWLNKGDSANCKRRVLRGGSWSGRALELRSAARANNKAEHKSIFIGFRVVRELH